MTQQLAQMSQRCFEIEESSQRQQVADEELEALRFQCDLQRQRTAESERMHAALKLQVEQVTEQERANTVQKRKLLMLYDDLQQQQGLVLAKEGELHRLSDELDRLRKSEAALQAALAAEAASKESLHDRAQKLEADLRDNEGRLQQALAELRTARSAGQLQRSAEDEVSVLKEALHNIRVEYSEQTEMLHAVKTLRDKLMHQSAETEELLSKEEDRNAGFMEELEFLRAQLDHETREKARLAEAHGDAKLRIEAAERAMEREQALLMQLADLQSSAAQAEDAASANALLNARITGLEAQLSDIRLALQGERQRNRELSAEVEDLQRISVEENSIRTRKMRAELLQVTEGQATQEILLQEKENQLHAAQEEMQRLRAIQRAAATDHDILEERYGRIEIEFRRLSSEYSENVKLLAEKTENLHASSASHDAEMRALRAELAELKRSSARAAVLHAEEMAAVQAALDEAKQAIDRMKRKSQQETPALEGQLEALQDEVEAQTQAKLRAELKLRNAERELARLRDVEAELANVNSASHDAEIRALRAELAELKRSSARAAVLHAEEMAAFQAALGEAQQTIDRMKHKSQHETPREKHVALEESLQNEIESHKQATLRAELKLRNAERELARLRDVETAFLQAQDEALRAARKLQMMEGELARLRQAELKSSVEHEHAGEHVAQLEVPLAYFPDRVLEPFPLIRSHCCR